ncbi:Eco57I restriction-modification methylase domain-containing protein [uncultured Draconibacterium sp.]|uniref:Eco57I restriction-modification methylase domain-containing protein n=1 Tax=uncultured Draconibacterium sp. TaxID=1573823 RepID=UPI002AA74A8A|nr:N-6 DNA methylase [uncultured Draconibacterium sp.]
MKKELFAYLKSYSFDPTKIDRLIVSAFLISNKVEIRNNHLLKSLFIRKYDSDYKHLKEFLEIGKFEKFEQLIELFEFVVSPEEKVITGAIYTPEIIRKYITNEVLKKNTRFDNLLICDPACGCAGFLYEAAKLLKEKTNKSYTEIIEQNVFGLDIQEYSVNRSRILLSLLAVIYGEDIEEFNFNLFKGNALNFQWDNHIENFTGFDIVLGNPPYVCSRNIDEESKKLLDNWSVCSTGHPDLYIPFFEIGFSILKVNGVLGYITMNSFFKSVNGRALREYFQYEKFNFKLIDFGSNQVFQSRSTYTCICIIQKTRADYLSYVRLPSIELLSSKKLSYNAVYYSMLDPFKGWNLQEIDIINKVESAGVPLGRKFKSRNGIATLKNKVYIFSPTDEDDNYYYFNNGKSFKIEKEICRNIINPNKLTKLDSIDSIINKVIFPYNIIKGQVKLIAESEFKKNYPETYNYLYANRKLLSERDKGKGNYENWYAYGRNQSLEKLKYKLFFPHIAPSIPNFVLNSDENLLFHNGLAIIGDNERELLFLQKIMSSRLFWFYITKTSKPYGSGYYSLSRNYIKNFGIHVFSEDEIDKIISEEDLEKLNKFIESKYGVQLDNQF